MALALPLLVAAALSVLTVHRFLNGPQGFNPDGLLTMRLCASRRPLSGRRQRSAQVRRATSSSDCARIPGRRDGRRDQRHAGRRTTTAGRSIEIDGDPNPDPSNPPSRRLPVGDAGTLRGAADADSSRAAASPTPTATTRSRSPSSTKSLARRHWPDADPIGKRMRIGTDPWMTVVGVCGDHIHGWFDRRNYPTLYRPFRQAPTSAMALLVRTSRDPATLAADARAAVRAVDPAQPVFELQPMRRPSTSARSACSTSAPSCSSSAAWRCCWR